MTPRQTAVVVFNPAAGQGRAEASLERLLPDLARAGFEAEPRPTRAAGDAIELSRQAATEGAEVVFALGGDGTLRECAAGVLGSACALAFLPAGTVNVMALELGLPRSARAAARAYANSEVMQHAVGLAARLPFLMQASAGVDAFLIAALRPAEKRRLGRVSVVPALLRALARYRFPEFGVSSGGTDHRVTLAVASNIARYGGPWKLTPAAGSDSSTLELFLFRGRGRSGAIVFALSLLLGRHLKLAASSLERTQRVSVETPADLPFQVDGDVFAPEPDKSLEISVSEHELSLLVPAAKGRS